MKTAPHGDITIAYETFGSAEGEPLLLISGTGVQMLIWPEDFCAGLVSRGFAVARSDNRDAGLSTHLTEAGAPGWLKALLRPGRAPYRLADMAGDAVAVMDTLGWASAHVVGASMGGMIAQQLAITYPDRVRSLTSIMSTPSSRIATMPTLAAMRAIGQVAGHPVTSPDQAAAAAAAMTRAAGRTSAGRTPRTTAPGSGPRSSHQATAAARWPACARPPWSSTVTRTPSSARRAAGQPPPPFPVPAWSPIPAWATTCPGRCGRPSSARSPRWPPAASRCRRSKR
jgi:pimeloyl-ACP methyl ester carboxylesterase